MNNPIQYCQCCQTERVDVYELCRYWLCPGCTGRVQYEVRYDAEADRVWMECPECPHREMAGCGDDAQKAREMWRHVVSHYVVAGQHTKSACRVPA